MHEVIYVVIDVDIDGIDFITNINGIIAGNFNITGVDVIADLGVITVISNVDDIDIIEYFAYDIDSAMIVIVQLDIVIFAHVDFVVDLFIATSKPGYAAKTLT